MKRWNEKLFKIKNLSPLMDRSKKAQRIALTYFIFGTFWIFLSDELLYFFIKDLTIFKEVQVYKGWFFVFITTLFMFFLVKSVMNVKGINKKDPLAQDEVIEAIMQEYFLNNMRFSTFPPDSDVIKDQLEDALKNDQLTIYYQPQVNIKTGKIIGVEALIRWQHPVRGFISPTEFIPFAEESGQIYEVERYVVETALLQKQTWEEEGYKNLKMSINLSSKTLANDESFLKLEEIIKTFNIDFSNIIFEITETAIISDINSVIKRLEKLREKGISIALDDFGTGYSSLSYLKDVPLNIIKIDRSFINCIKENGRETFITKALLALAKDLNYDVIAEGIETGEQLQFLLNHNCNFGQGYLFSKPLPVHLINEELRMSSH